MSSKTFSRKKLLISRKIGRRNILAFYPQSEFIHTCIDQANTCNTLATENVIHTSMGQANTCNTLATENVHHRGLLMI